MINKLKRKFLLIGTVFTFVLMTVLVLTMNLVNYREVTRDADAVLDVLSRPDLPLFNENGRSPSEQPPGEQPPGEQPPDEQPPDEQPPEERGMDEFVPRGMSPEVPYESRFFTVRVSSDGEIVQSDLSRIVSVDEDAAKEYIEKALASKKARGLIGDFRYLKETDENGTRIVFLDCGRKLDSFRGFLWISVIVGLGGCVAVFFAFVFAAGKIVSPIAESYEKQKRFISDAGHEIKTPLTIINANVDLLESDGEREELTDIRQQTERLTELTNNLVMLSKMEEAQPSFQKIEFPLSDVVGETAASFRAPATARGIDCDVTVASGIVMKGSPDAIRRLVSVLMDNAVKYSPDGGKIAVTLAAHRKTATLSVCNLTKEKIEEKDLVHVFDRFYRTDASRNSETGGHGIGLSIAKAIAEAHGGGISAATKTGSDFSVIVNLPL